MGTRKDRQLSAKNKSYKECRARFHLSQLTKNERNQNQNKKNSQKQLQVGVAKELQRQLTNWQYTPNNVQSLKKSQSGQDL